LIHIPSLRPSKLNSTGCQISLDRRPPDIILAFRLPEFNSNYEGELAGILHSLETIQQHLYGKNFIIFTDCKSILEKLKNGLLPKDSQLKGQIFEILTEMTQRVKWKMVWVPGHINIPGNEKADVLAKMGAQTRRNNQVSISLTTRRELSSISKKKFMMTGKKSGCFQSIVTLLGR
jgi:ribonuclease HI